MIRTIFSGTTGLGRRLFVLSVLAIGIAILSPLANASILSTGVCPFSNPGDQNPPCLANGVPAGTLLASLSAPFVSTLGTTSGTLLSAVYRESGGTLDFYYQVTNNLTAPNCGGAGQNPCDPLNRETNVDFSTWMTQLAYRTDCKTTVPPAAPGPGSCTIFANGDTAPGLADRNIGIGNVIGFTFNADPTPTPILPGHTSNVLIISTNATNYKTGNSSVIDGGTTTVSSFEPSSATPEPASLALVGLGLVALAGFRRRSQTRR